MRTVDQAVAAAKAMTSCDKGMCLSTVQEWWQSGHAYPDAAAQWNATIQHRGDRNPPVGAPVFYAGGKHGHIALYLGNGQIRSTDCPSTYKVGTTDLDWPKRAWGYSYSGWGETLAGNRLPLGGTSGKDDDDMPSADEVADAVWNRIMTSSDGTAGPAAAWGFLTDTRAIVGQTVPGVWGASLERSGVGPAAAQDWLADGRIEAGNATAAANAATEAANKAAALCQQVLDRLDALEGKAL